LVASVEHGEPPFYDTISNTIYACTWNKVSSLI
jgi:hypothetical protein